MSLELQTARFCYPLRIYYEDTDAAGMVYYANYLRFMERARTEWLRLLGFQQSRLVETHGIAFVARSAHIDYLRPAHLDDELLIVNTVAQVGRAQVTFEQAVERAGERLAHGRVRIACIAPASGKPAALPPDMLSALRALCAPAP